MDAGRESHTHIWLPSAPRPDTLGATAAQALLGSTFRITRQRDGILGDTGLAPKVMATSHPSAILRMPDARLREEARSLLAADLRVTASALTGR